MKRNILLLGAGKSSGSLIDYFSKHAVAENWELTVADSSVEQAKEKTAGIENTRAVGLDIRDEQQLHSEIKKCSMVVSLLPAHLHMPVARACVALGKHLATASYVSEEMLELNDEAVKRGVILLNECGLDPGIDHMSAMEIIDKLRSENAELTSFKSYTGGLVAPGSDDNPWGYKFSWNPRNVILAGQGTARFMEEGKLRYVPYQRLFTDTQSVSIKGMENGQDTPSLQLEGYANRDSLAYRKIYGLDSIPTLVRGTLRKKNFCKAWNVFVQLGLTDDSYHVEGSEHLTYGEWVQSYFPPGLIGNTAEEKLADFMQLDLKGEIMAMVLWTGVLSDQKTDLVKATPAQILQKLLETKWKLKDSDKDMIVMQHIFKYKKQDSNNVFEIRSSLIAEGKDARHTAMAKTVGLPLAIASKLILNNKIPVSGVRIPVSKEFYVPVLEELKNYDIRFTEEHHALSMSL